ncbi:hypothetical protein ACOSP7_006601 [Xanthoceras sorbifolium]
MDQEMKHFDVARMIIENGILSLNSIKIDILRLPCRFSLTINRFERYSRYDACYCLTRKIISVKCLEGAGDIETLKSVLLDWNIHRSIIATGFRSQGSLRFGGNLISISTLVRALEDIVSNFQIAIYSAKSMGLKVTSQGVPSTSASDMELLESAVGFKEAFLWLARTDPIFKSITLKYKDWNKASALHECFQICISLSFVRYLGNWINWKKKSLWFVTEKASPMRYTVLDRYSDSSTLDIVKHWCRKLYDTDADIFYTMLNLQIDRAIRKYEKVEDFDILGLWCFNAWRFPVLAMMACDFLAVSFSTPHKCSFVEVKKLVDSEHLDSDIMEAFICTESWLEKP